MADRPVPRPFVINRDVVREVTTAQEIINEAGSAPTVCPECGSVDLNRDDIDGTDILTLTWSCEECEFAWIETYGFMGWEPKN
jgi:predicted RNA-binding Zn-ribbon protein involved in translation (DUF1610 family)